METTFEFFQRWRSRNTSRLPENRNPDALGHDSQSRPSDGLPDFENHSEQETRYTTCYMCACRCGIKVTLENNKIRFIEGNKNHPVNRGVLCAKGAAGIMKQASPGKLRGPLRRVPGSERGAGAFEEISWDEAIRIFAERLQTIRETHPNRLAFFTGRDQMQALTGLWAREFGTLNWAAHGGFCSVNMAAAGLYTLGYSFWEFGEPDFDRTQYLMLWGVAEDHSSNPIKIGLEKVKRRGAKLVSINPVRTGYSAIADEWVPIRPGTDGMLAMSLIHVLLRDNRFDWEFLLRFTNAPWLVGIEPGAKDEGLFVRDEEGRPLMHDINVEQEVSALEAGRQPALFGEFTLANGTRAKTVMTLLFERYSDSQYAPERAAAITGVAAETIERLARELATVAFEQTIEIDTPWTDWAGRQQQKFIGRPVSMHAMRGVSAHSNGFQACRAIHILQMLLGAIDGPGSFRAKPPYPKPAPPPVVPARDSGIGQSLNGPQLGFPTAPEELVVDAHGNPLRIDKAFSWEAPLAAHGLMHTVIRNAAEADPYPIDTLLLFMSNMAWNSGMNPRRNQDYLRAKDEHGNYRIPFVVVVDAFHSEMVNFADLVLPDTTYLERFDAISLLDRPISEPDAACDSIRQPVLLPDRDVRPWQDVMIELAGRLKLPSFVHADGRPRYHGYEDFIIGYQDRPGIGFLSGWRGADGSAALRGDPNPRQWQAYIENQCFARHEVPESGRYYKFANRVYLEWAQQAGFLNSTDRIVLQLWSEPLQKFRLALDGRYAGPVPPEGFRTEASSEALDPLPRWQEPLEHQRTGKVKYPLHAITQRPMMMYHSWDSQNAWLRQIISRNYLYMNPRTAERMGIYNLGWAWVESPHGRIRVQVKHMEGVEEQTVWTWNAIGKQSGTWGLKPNADEARQAFLLNHLISELLPPKDEAVEMNSDPVTGQAAWYDLRVGISPAEAPNAQETPEFGEIVPLPGAPRPADQLSYRTHTPVRLHRRLLDILTRR